MQTIDLIVLAWVAFAAMCIAIGAALLAQRALASALTKQHA